MIGRRALQIEGQQQAIAEDESAKAALQASDPMDLIEIETPLPPGWVGIGPAKVLLTSADVILGPTTRPGVQIGKQRKTRDGYTVTFDQLYLPAYEPIEKWLACRYGQHLALAQRLPDKTDVA